MGRAEFDDQRRYRYLLERDIAPLAQGRSRVCTFVMLNPSTADEHKDDATIRQCIGFARRWGCTTLRAVNLSPLRATNPEELLAAGPEPAEVCRLNLEWIRWAVEGARIVVVAWGAHRAAAGRAERVLGYLGELGVDAYVLGWTRAGHPLHPLRVPRDTPLKLFRHRRG